MILDPEEPEIIFSTQYLLIHRIHLVVKLEKGSLHFCLVPTQ
jgi:hypothetical protein